MRKEKVMTGANTTLQASDPIDRMMELYGGLALQNQAIIDSEVSLRGVFSRKIDWELANVYDQHDPQSHCRLGALRQQIDMVADELRSQKFEAASIDGELFDHVQSSLFGRMVRIVAVEEEVTPVTILMPDRRSYDRTLVVKDRVNRIKGVVGVPRLDRSTKLILWPTRMAKLKGVSKYEVAMVSPDGEPLVSVKLLK